MTGIIKKTILILLPITLTSCSLNKLAVKSTGAVIDKGLTAVYKEKDPEFAKAALPANLQLMEILLENDPTNKKLLLNAAMGFCGYGFMFIEDENPERACAMYEKGSAYALTALRLSGAVKEDRVSPEAITVKNAPFAFWNSFCRAAFVNLNRDNPDAVAELPKIMPVTEAVAKITPSYYYNGAFAMIGTYHALLPKILGGNPEKAKINFEKAIQGTGKDFLLNRFMYAKMYGVAAQDEAFFTNTLNEILSAELKNDDSRLANEVAKLKAKKLLEKKNELF